MKTRNMTRTSPTQDLDAKAINQMANDVIRYSDIGSMLRGVLLERFKGDKKAFRRWVRQNLDISDRSADRYMFIAEYGEIFAASGCIRLLEVYERLCIDGRDGTGEQDAL